MPLDEFIDAAMKDLASDVEELPVVGARYLHKSGVAEGFRTAFEQMNS
jgi:hypothetical protein